MQPTLLEALVVDKGVHRQELNRRHTQCSEIIDDDRRCKARVSATEWYGHIRMLFGKALDVQFVDHRAMKWRLGAAIIAPIEARIDDDTFGHRPRAVALIGIQICVGVAALNTIEGLVPDDPTTQ